MISAVIICKNENRFLDGCLDSLAGFEEIIVYDNAFPTLFTHRANVRYFYEPSTAPISVLRNLAIEKSTGNTIFTIDADERLEGAVEEDGVQVVEIFGPQTKLSGKRVFSRSYVTSVFPRQYRYQGLIHESINYHGPLKKSKARIAHLGYDLSVGDIMSKHCRYLALLEEERAQIKVMDSRAVKVFFFLAKAKLMSGEFEEAIAYFSFCKPHLPIVSQAVLEKQIKNIKLRNNL